MFGLGFTEILFILVIALLVLGPKKLPGAARDLGRITAQLKRAMDDFRHDLHVSSNITSSNIDADTCCDDKSKSPEPTGETQKKPTT